MDKIHITYTQNGPLSRDAHFSINGAPCIVKSFAIEGNTEDAFTKIVLTGFMDSADVNIDSLPPDRLEINGRVFVAMDEGGIKA